MTAHRCHDCGATFFVRNSTGRLRKRCSPCDRRLRNRRKALKDIPEPARLELVALRSLVMSATTLVSIAARNAYVSDVGERWLKRANDALQACPIAERCQEAAL